MDIRSADVGSAIRTGWSITDYDPAVVAAAPRESLRCFGAAPFTEPEESIDEQNELREILADAVDSLTEEEQWIFLMLTKARLSLRFVGSVLGVPKTTLARRRDRIIRKLQEQLSESTLVQERLNL